MPVINRAGMTSTTPSEEASKQKSASSGGYDINELRQRTDAFGEKADDYKYQIAVELARSDLGSRADSDKELFEKRIDKYLEDLGASKSGDDFRGENWFTKGVEAADGFIDGLTGAGGAVIDGVFDNTVGNIGSLLGFGDKWKDAFDANDMQVVADAALDLGLSAIPGVGIGLAAGKNLIQSSDALKELTSGRDSSTLERLNGWQNLGNGLTVALGTLGSIVPGFGKTRQLLKASGMADDIAEAAAKEGAEELAQSAAKEGAEELAKSAAKEAVESGGEAAAKAAGKEAAESAAESAGKEAAEEAAQESASRGIRGAIGRTRQNIENVRARSGQLKDEGHGVLAAYNTIRGVPQAVSEGLFPYTSRDSRLLRKFVQADEAAESIARNEAAQKSLLNRGLQYAGTIPSALGRNVLPGIGGAIAGTMADTGLNPVQSGTVVLKNAYDNAISGDIGQLIPLLSNFGLSGIGRRMPNPRGTMSTTNMPVATSRAFSMADYARNDEESREANAKNDNIDTRGFTEQELLDYLEYAGRMMNNA